MQYADGPNGRRSEEFNLSLNPVVRDMVSALDAWSRLNAIPEVIITECVRTLEEQEHIYVGYWKRLIASMDAGSKLSSIESNTAMAMHGKTDAELQSLARDRFSWHMVNCAVDIRTTVGGHYTMLQSKLVFDFLKSKIKTEASWELMAHDVAGPHIHIGYKDFSYRNKYDPRPTQKAKK